MTLLKTLLRAKEVEQKESPELAAARRAEEIIAQATKEATALIEEAHVIKENSTRAIEEALQASRKNVADEMQQQMSALSKQLNEAIQQTTEELRREMREALEKSLATTGQQLSSVDRELQKVAADERQKLQANLEEVRRKKIHSLTATLQKQIPAIAKEVIGRSLSLADHEQLVRDALERTRHENIWV